MHKSTGQNKRGPIQKKARISRRLTTATTLTRNNIHRKRAEPKQAYPRNNFMGAVPSRNRWAGNSTYGSGPLPSALCLYDVSHFGDSFYYYYFKGVRFRGTPWNEGHLPHSLLGFRPNASTASSHPIIVWKNASSTSRWPAFLT